jgi:dTMP kinase
MKGKLIVFEGVSGTGKETQAKLLQKFLATQKIKSNIVFHPSPELKEIFSAWRKERSIDALTETYLLLADRSSRVRQQIRPALEKGEWVISLRNYVSALVYQGKTEKDWTWITNEFLRFEPKPDYLFYFDITPGDAMKRILLRGEPLGKFETPTLLNEKRKNYKKILQAIPHITVDASQSIERIHRGIISNLHIV